MLNWKDASDYSQGEKKGEPKSWAATAGKFRIVITRVHRQNPDRWTMHIYPGLHDTYDLASLLVPVDDVKLNAESHLRFVLQAGLKELEA